MGRTLHQSLRIALIGGASTIALAAHVPAASAGGFSPKEQSTVFLGSAFAGSAAGGALSSMFWNSAAVGQFNGINSESSYSLILPDSEITATAGSTFLAAGANSGDIGDTAVLPASYFSYQLSNELVVGLSVNAPFGLVTDPGKVWAGSSFARESAIETYNINPTVAYRLAPWLTVGAGLQVEYFKAYLRQGFGSPAGPTAITKGDDWAVGYTLGVIVTPASGTTIGVGFRSSIDHELEDSFSISGVSNPVAISAGIETPEILTVSLRQQLTPDWALLGTFEWNNWSRVQELNVVCGEAGFPCPAAGATLTNLELGWHDGYFFSGGLEHNYSDQLTLRGGVAYEISPIQNPDERTIRVPDADRVWLTVGASYKYSEWTTIDFAYAHVFVEDSTTDRTEFVGASPRRLVGDVESSVDILSIGWRTKLDWLVSGNY
ncbi:MAG: OmpP1/FadL family transporter [Hyphomicrobium sp.]|nr:OmpP1/FadL family transporter [Hyphomicrobium sp.]